MSSQVFYPLALCMMLAACSGTGSNTSNPANPGTGTSDAHVTVAGKGLQPFADEQEFEALIATWAEKAEEQRKQRARTLESATMMGAVPAPPPAPAAPAAMEAGADAESITNVQTQGVDEGGIVKRHGDHLVVLRRGRLFTVRIGGDQLQPVSTVDAYGPNVDPLGAWYDEMLVAGDTVAVIGYSYARGGTELALFDISGKGELAYRDTWHLRSNDYYSSRNYASRLIGNTLVLYTPMVVNAWNLEKRDFLPAYRRWHPQAVPSEFKRILPATRIFRSDDELDPFNGGVALHTVTRCDLSAPELACTSSAVLGPVGRVFYVSADSVFVWTGSPRAKDENRSAVFRIPLDERTPSALKTRGMPIDQLSFLHDGEDHLNVLVSSVGAGEGMWGDETSAGELALLRVPLASFGDGRDAAPASAYRRLPGSVDGSMQNRYVGPWLLYGSAPHRWARPGKEEGNGVTAFALRFADTQPVQALALDHGSERIEAMGRDAIIVGSAGSDLHFTSVRLGQRDAGIVNVYVQAQAAQGESRTHGFFYRNDSTDEGIVGLPVVGQRRSNTMQRYLDESASVLYLRNRERALSPMGELVADADKAVSDNCRASCADWYGNARPIFIGERVFALMGYELVEGRVENERIVERRRASFAPGVAIAD